MTVERAEEMRAIYRKAMALINKGWTRGAEARGANGKVVDPDSQNAVRFCLIGAINRNSLDMDIGFRRQVYGFVQACLPCPYPWGLVGFNDEVAKSKQDVLKVLECAIQKIDAEVPPPTSQNTDFDLNPVSLS